MFNKPFKSNVCAMNPARLGREFKSERHHLPKVGGWHSSAHLVFTQPMGTDRALVRAEGLERTCAARSLKELTCVRAVEEARAKEHNVTYVPRTYTLSKTYHPSRIFTYTSAALCPPLVAGRSSGN